MLKIVHIITRFVNGGADENTLLTCNHQVEAGHCVWLMHGPDATARMLGKLDPRVEAICIASLVRDVSLFQDIHATMSIARMLRHLSPDIVHTHTSKAGIVGRFAAIAYRRSKVVHGVHILPFTEQPLLKRFIYLAFERLAAVRTDAFIDVSEGMRDLCLANGVGDQGNHFVVRSGMDIDLFRTAEPAADMREILPCPPDSVQAVAVLYVAVLERRKRHREFFLAMVLLLKMRPEVHLFFAGEGPELSALQQLVANADCENRVSFLGYREDVAKVISAADICVFSSKREGLPRSIVQYAMCGKPIIATALPGIELVVREAENGYVVPSDDFVGLVRCVEHLCGDAIKRQEMSDKSAALDFSHWDARIMSSEIEIIYRNLLSLSLPPSSGSVNEVRTTSQLEQR